MTPEERLTRLENNLLKLSAVQNATADSLKLYKYELFVPFVEPPLEYYGMGMVVVLRFDTTFDQMPLVLLHQSPNRSATGGSCIHPSGGSDIRTKKYVVSQWQDTKYILVSTQPGSFYKV
jgi:hypothetical protein